VIPLLHTHKSYLSALRWCIMIKRYINPRYLIYLLAISEIIQDAVNGDIANDF